MIQLKRNPRNKKKNRAYLWNKTQAWETIDCEEVVWERDSVKCGRNRAKKRQRSLQGWESWEKFETGERYNVNLFYIIICNFVNLEWVNWRIHLVNNLSTLLSISFLKKLTNKVIKLLSLPLLYSPSFFKHPNRP